MLLCVCVFFCLSDNLSLNYLFLVSMFFLYNYISIMQSCHYKSCNFRTQDSLCPLCQQSLKSHGHETMVIMKFFFQTAILPDFSIRLKQVVALRTTFSTSQLYCTVFRSIECMYSVNKSRSANAL